jgi:membrane protease YdiL (CAAX protease family)
VTVLGGGAAAVMAIRTGRLGAGLALHITYNASILIPVLLA